MESYLKIEVKHSTKKDVDYISSSIVLGGKSYFINLTYEVLSVILDMTVRDVMKLDSKFEARKFPIDIGE